MMDPSVVSVVVPVPAELDAVIVMSDPGAQWLVFAVTVFELLVDRIVTEEGQIANCEGSSFDSVTVTLPDIPDCVLSIETLIDTFVSRPAMDGVTTTEIGPYSAFPPP